MKKIVTTLTIFQLLIAPVFSQEYPGCFLIDEFGNRMNLGELCPEAEKPLTENIETPKTENIETPKQENQPPIAPSETPTNTNNNSGENESEKPENQAKFFSVPIKKKVGGIPLIDVTFNGDKTFEMLFDTGATITTITPNMVTQLNITPQQKIPVSTAAGIMETNLGKVNSMKAGNLEVNNLSVAITPALSFGLLGQNFYQNYDLSIKENVIEFSLRNQE